MKRDFTGEIKHFAVHSAFYCFLFISWLLLLPSLTSVTTFFCNSSLEGSYLVVHPMQLSTKI